jgi:flavin-dependent dehydrogenase
MNELKTKYDVIVAGAGIAGISAAVKAAREGVSVF